jgi:glycosyltransferase involved in cell wall biosynthesis
MAAYYRAATVVVVPSDYESFSLVTVEAQATGAIVVGSDIPGMRSKIIPGKTGFLFTPGSASMLARQIETIDALPKSELQSIKQTARQQVLERYTLPAHLDALEKIYRSVVERN